MTVPAIVDFNSHIPAEESAPAEDKRLAGDPRCAVANRYADASGQFFAGDWSSTVGKWRVEYTEHEFCQLVEGRVSLVSDDGQAWRFGPGDAWVIPAGFKGTWETLEPARKRYAIFERAEG